MSSFRFVDFNVSSMTQEQMDSIALCGGVVGHLSGGYDCRAEVPASLHGYGLRWIGTHGVGNRGRLVLTPRSARAAEYLRQGAVEVLMDQFGLHYAEADSLYSASRGVPYGREHEVLAYCVENRDCVHAWAHVPEDSTWRARRRWEAEWRMPPCDLSCPRWEAVVAVMRAWR